MLFAILLFLRIQEGNSRIQTRVVGYQVPNRQHDSQSKEERSMEEKSYPVHKTLTLSERALCFLITALEV